MPLSTYLRATANSLDKVNRSVLLLGNMAAKMSVNKPEEEKVRQMMKKMLVPVSPGVVTMDTASLSHRKSY